MTQSLAIRDEQHYLLTVREVRTLAERCDTVEDAKAVADKSRTLQVWAERARLGADQVNLAAAARLWAERRAGELLIESRENGHRDPGGRGPVESRHATQLSDLGITKHESSRYQQLAEIPEPEFEQAIEQAATEGAVSAAKVRRIAQPEMVVPIDEVLLARQQRETLISSLDRAIYALESPPSTAVAEAERLLAGGDAGPFTPDRFERVIAYCSAFAETLKGAA